MTRRTLTWLLGILMLGNISSALAGTFRFLGMDAETQLLQTYAFGIRLEERHPGVIDAPGRKSVPIPDYLKYPESNNFDDGSRNFDRYAPVNNRLTFLGELLMKWNDDFGFLVRGDAFYDTVYTYDNDNNGPDRISTTQMPHDSFTRDARKFAGARARLLDAYAFGTWYFGDYMALNMRAGSHIAAWGESLFFSGVALAQAPADATKATVPGADVKSILLPVNQVSMQFTVSDKITLLGQYKLQFKEFELNPVGEFFSIADVVGPGAEFIYGIRNPFFGDNLSQFNFTSNDPIETIDLIDLLVFGDQLPDGPKPVPEGFDAVLPMTGQSPPGTPEGINVQRGPDIRPSAGGQWGAGIRYAPNFTTSLGFYHLRYHNLTPGPVQNYGYATLVPGQNGGPPITTEYFQTQVPVTYNIRFFDGIHLSAASFSTVLFGTNFGGELIYRDGVDVLVDVNGGPLTGPIPTPSRSRVGQALLSALYVTGPGWFWDAVTIVAEGGYTHVIDVDQQPNPDGELFDKLTYSRDAGALAVLAIVDKRAIFPGWDLRMPIQAQGVIHGRSSLLGAFGALVGENDYRFGFAVELTRLQKLTFGIAYQGFLGRPHFDRRPYQDRDTLSLTIKSSL